MYWKDKPEDKRFEASCDVVDLSFKIECKALPLDHAFLLSSALLKAAPWLAQTKSAAIHLIHGAESGNGWERPNDPELQLLHLSKRARFTLRIHNSMVDQARDLVGLDFSIDGHPLTLKEYKTQLLVPQTTIFSRYIETKPALSEDAFLDSVAPTIQSMGVNIRKMMSGKQHTFKTEKGEAVTRSLMLSDLDKEDSILLQQNGVGNRQLMGFGIFLPHKGISAVHQVSS